MTGEQASMSVDSAFEVLSHRYRRYAMVYLVRHTPPVHLSQLASYIANTTTDGASHEETEQVYIELYHHHIPKLEDLDVIEFDRDQREVELATDPDLIEEYLEQIEGQTV